MTICDALSAILDHDTQPLVRLIVVSTEGSVPREPGAAMLVSRDGATGTIGGGQLEYEAIAHARKLLAQAEAQPGDWLRDIHTWPLGPAIGQCCGGTVQLLFEHFGPNEFAHIAALASEMNATGSPRNILIHPTGSGEPISICCTRPDARALPLRLARTVDDMLSGLRSIEPVFLKQSSNEFSHFIEPIALRHTSLYIYGAGHIGQAIVKIASDLDFNIHWVDTHAERFPAKSHANVRRVVARDPAIIAHAAPKGAFHVVLTYSHAMDLAICHALLAKPVFGFLGLIGSQTKRARFHKRLRDGGISSATLDRLTCPIGIGGLRGKEPATIAVAVVAQLIERLEFLREAGGITAEGEHGTSQRISA
ncbi:MAG: xanthine dehydrogenase accessory protein XdhC [Hyphomicrobiaceae bacterium]